MTYDLLVVFRGSFFKPENLSAQIKPRIQIILNFENFGAPEKEVLTFKFSDISKQPSGNTFLVFRLFIIIDPCNCMTSQVAFYFSLLQIVISCSL